MLMRSSRVLPIVVLVVAFVLGFWTMRRPVHPRAAPVVAVTHPSPSPVAQIAVVVPSASPSPLRRTVRTETEIAPMGIIPEMGSVSTKTADDYVKRARFPRSSQPIADGVDPIARDREVTRGKSAGPEGTNPTLVVWPQRTGFEAPSPIVLHAYLVHDKRKVDPTEITGEIRTQQGGVLAALDFHDDGTNGDDRANDLIFTSVVAPGRERAIDFKGAQLVEVHARIDNGAQRVATTGFLYSIPLGHLTGHYRDEIVGGNLIVSAEVLVDATARFHLEATLSEMDGTAFGWSQNALVLEAGTVWIPLSYWGLMFRDRGSDGPYLVSSVALSTTGEMPNQKNDVATNAHVTKSYPVTAFSERPFNDPALLDAAARLRADAPAGIGGVEAGSGR
ncbi:MAG: hypothetical protein ABIR79_05410 [Candidatus Binatia bacterium]